MKTAASIFRLASAVLLGLVVIAAPGLQAFQPQSALQTTAPSCSCGCGCSSEPVANGCETEAATTGCGCSMEAPKAIPEAPLLASTPAPHGFDFTAVVIDNTHEFEATSSASPRDFHLSGSARRGPPLFILHSSFLI